MSESSLHAWVIHKRWSGNTSVQVVLFTREKGLISCLYKGGRAPKKQSMLQIFTPVWVHLKEQSTRCYLQKIELLSSSLPLTGQSLFASLYLNELLCYALQPFDPHPTLYDAYTIALQTLSETLDQLGLEAVLRRFEWSLLLAMGHCHSLTHDARTNLAIVDTHYYQFIPGEGMVEAAEGILGAHLLLLASDQLDSPQVMRSAKKMMRAAIDHALGGREIKTRGLYSSRHT